MKRSTEFWIILLSFAACMLLSFTSSICAQEKSAEKAKPTEQEIEQLQRLEKALRDSGINPDSDGVQAYFQAFDKFDEAKQLTERWLRQLGSPDYHQREFALKKLVSIPCLDLDVLKLVIIKNKDPQVVWHAELLVNRSKAIHRQNTKTALQLIAAKKIEGLARDVFFVLDHSKNSDEFRDLALNALKVTAVEQDQGFLEEMFNSGPPERKLLSIYALRQIATKPKLDWFASVAANHKEPDGLRMHAGFALADLEDLRCLDVLVELLSAEDVVIRVRANAALAALTQQKLNYVAYGELDKRKLAIQDWTDWIAENRSTIKLHLPIDDYMRRRSYLNGNTLIAQGYKNRVVELDPSKKVIWEYTCNGPWSAEKLENGNVLIAAYRDNKVIEVNAKKEIVWEMPANGVLNCRPLENGNILMSLYSESRVVEVNRAKKVVWEYKATSSLADAVRLQNGNTIITTNNNVAEIDPKGNEVWTFAAAQGYGINLTEKGTLLVSQLGGSVVELDRKTKKEIWKFSVSNPVDAFRTETGNTLVTTGTHTVEVDPSGKEIWRFDGANYGTARR